MNTATREIYDMAVSISKICEGGEKFFDLLDNAIINHTSNNVMEELFKLVPSNTFLVLSGGFGKSVAEKIDNGSYPLLPYMLFAGGIRKGNGAVLLKQTITDIDNVGIFLDDSIYGGATFYKIQESVGKTKLPSAAVIYDGCPIKKDYISSIFRYYDHFDAKPTHSF